MVYDEGWYYGYIYGFDGIASVSAKAISQLSLAQKLSSLIDVYYTYEVNDWYYINLINIDLDNFETKVVSPTSSAAYLELPITEAKGPYAVRLDSKAKLVKASLLYDELVPIKKFYRKWGWNHQVPNYIMISGHIVIENYLRTLISLKCYWLH